MNKSKEKRIRKELDKLLHLGRYLEWIEKVIERDLQKAYAQQWKEVWQTVARHAWRLPEKLAEVCLNIKGITSYADIPDVRFLFLLKDFLYEDKYSDELLTIKGLSISAEELRKRVLTWKEESFPEKKLRRMLLKFVTSPEKITKKYYIDIAALLNDDILYTHLTSFGERITYIRSIRTKNYANLTISRLNEVDDYLHNMSKRLPYHLYEVLSYPFIFIVTDYLRNITKSAKAIEVVNIVSSIPYIFSLVAGEKAEAIKEKLINYNPDIIDEEYINKKVSTGSFEEKVALIRKLRYLIKKEEAQSKYSHYMIALYEGILSEVTRQRANLSEREKKELPEVIGNVIQKDIQLLWKDQRELTHILLMTAENGCLNTKLAMLSLLVSEDSKNKKLMGLAQKAIDTLPKPTAEDMDWLDTFDYIFLPRISRLKPLVEIYSNEKIVLEKITNMISQEINQVLMKNSLLLQIKGDFSFALDDIMPSESKKTMRILRLEIVHFQRYDEFARIIDVLDCYKDDDCITVENQRCLFNKLYTRGGIDLLVTELKNVIQQIDNADIVDDMLDIFMEENSPGKLLRQKLDVGFGVIKEHWEDLMLASDEIIDNIVQIISKYYLDSDILIRLSNLLETRHQTGNNNLEPLRHSLEKLLDKLKKSKKDKKKSKNK